MIAPFPFHDPNSAPDDSKTLLKELLTQSGPNGFYAVTAESPQTLAAYNALHQLFSSSSFSDTEKTVVWQSINVENDCHFCVPAHSKMARMMKVSEAVNEALRNETPLPDPKLEALRDFTLLMVRNRGHVSDAEMADFLSAGYTHRNMLEIVLGLAQKTISNYVNHLARTPVDKQYEEYAWSRKELE